MPREKLFSVKPEELKFGVVPGKHVAHIIGERGKNSGQEIIFGGEDGTAETRENISQLQTYNTEGDKKIKEQFMNLAKRAADDYEAEYATKTFQNVLLAIKDYLTAPTYEEQQNAIMHLKYKMIDCYESMESKNTELDQKIKEGKASPAEIEEHEKNAKCNKSILKYAETFQKIFSGDLKVPEDEKAKLSRKKIEEPHSVRWYFDGVGSWKNTNRVLFPHDPSPNDIKQGVGLMDCYVLSALIQIADKQPEKIKEAIKDNEDGTVTVRFFDKENGNKPYYVKVNKTVNETVFGHNFYAQSSLWVDILEKAYAQYAKEHLQSDPNHSREDIKAGSLAGIDRGKSYDFLNAFVEDKHYISTGSLGDSYPMKMRARYSGSERGPLPKYYLPEEKELFTLLQNAVRNENEYITVGISQALTMSDAAKDEFKKIGLRPGHAYTVRDFITKKGPDGKDRLYVRLRDPYATFMTGYNEKGRMENRSGGINKLINSGVDNMGTFDVEYRDFQMLFGGALGISENLVQKIEKLQVRDYIKDPLTDEEILDETKLKTDLPKKPRGIFADARISAYDVDVPAEIDTVRWKDIEYDRIREALDDPEKLAALSKNIENVVKDLKATDQWYVWTNSKAFNYMRDGLYEINKAVKALASGNINDKGIIDDLKDSICKKFVETKNDARTYISIKSDKINAEIAKDNKPNTRSIHRLTSAMNIEAVLGLGEPITNWHGKEKESLNIMLQDIAERYNMLTADKEIPHDVFKQKELQLKYNMEPEAAVKLRLQNEQCADLKKVIISLSKLKGEEAEARKDAEYEGFVIPEEAEYNLEGKEKRNNAAIDKIMEENKIAEQASVDDF